jgi:hypothetical protein
MFLLSTELDLLLESDFGVARRAAPRSIKTSEFSVRRLRWRLNRSSLAQHTGPEAFQSYATGEEGEFEGSWRKFNDSGSV